MLELYQFEQCPHSTKVREKLTELNIDFICRNARQNTDKRQIIQKLGGKDQVPFLVDFDNQIFLYGEDEINQYLDKTYS